jgi:hypothetical protein
MIVDNMFNELENSIKEQKEICNLPIKCDE